MSLTSIPAPLTSVGPYGCLANILTHLCPTSSPYFIISTLYKRSLSLSANDFCSLPPGKDVLYHVLPPPASAAEAASLLVHSVPSGAPGHCHLPILLSMRCLAPPVSFLLHQQFPPLFCFFPITPQICYHFSQLTKRILILLFHSPGNTPVLYFLL